MAIEGERRKKADISAFEYWLNNPDLQLFKEDEAASPGETDSPESTSQRRDAASQQPGASLEKQSAVSSEVQEVVEGFQAEISREREKHQIVYRKNLEQVVEQRLARIRALQARLRNPRKGRPT